MLLMSGAELAPATVSVADVSIIISKSTTIDIARLVSFSVVPLIVTSAELAPSILSATDTLKDS